MTAFLSAVENCRAMDEAKAVTWTIPAALGWPDTLPSVQMRRKQGASPARKRRAEHLVLGDRSVFRS
ncbi:unnamed protein product [Periconia digitata]|uniref:Uncharacterized protein n=1 Tax=Periconia digitata TaxID=1303443 RepID=A0A9W4ULR2_9PLEO|nr:unnamed protein product [Periconia digitata]